jgi:hypothetical protein
MPVGVPVDVPMVEKLRPRAELILAVCCLHFRLVLCERIVSSTDASAKVSIPFPWDNILECIVYKGEKGTQRSLSQRGGPVGKSMQNLVADGCIVSSKDAVVTVSTPPL